MHTIFSFLICIIEIVMRKGQKTQKEAGIGPFLQLVLEDYVPINLMCI